MQRFSLPFAFLLLGLGLGGGAHGQGPEPVYRCGSEYTNAPLPTQHCEVLPVQNITVITGTRPAGTATTAPIEPLALGRTKIETLGGGGAPAWGAVGGAGLDAPSRQAQQRSILVAELEQTRQRHAQLVQELNASEPDRSEGERNPQKHLDRLNQIKAGIARAERDMDSLQRELSKWSSTQASRP